jgi:hypothetical protein
VLRICFTAIFSTATVFAAAPVIGIATASGHFNVQSSEVWGNSTLFDGATVQTDRASSELALRNGVKVQLGAASKAQVWENRVLLERGVGQVAAPSAYEVDAAGLKIKADGARLRIGITDRIEVVAFSGSARVTTQAGFLLASIPPGRAMSFAMQAGSTGVTSRTGCLLYKDGHYVMQDENTQEVAELSGSNLASNTGNRVTVTGTATGARPAVSIATVSIAVSNIKTESQGGCLSVATVLDAKTEAPAGAAAANSGGTVPASTPASTTPAASSGGLSKGAKIAIIVAAAGGAAGAAIALAGHKSSTSP